MLGKSRHCLVKKTANNFSKNALGEEEKWEVEVKYVRLVMALSVPPESIGV